MNGRSLPFLIMALLLFAAGVLLLAGRFSSQAQAEEPGGIIQPDVLVALQESSEVAVIINLAALALPPPGQLDPATLDEYRRQVAAVQDRVLAKLTPADFTLTFRYSVTTALAGRITESGVEKLRGHPDVKMVVTDRDVFLDPIQTLATPPGDVNCNGTVNSTDAVLVLLLDAALIQALPCEGLADVNGDGGVDARDATVILQIVAGLCCVQTPTATIDPAIWEALETETEVEVLISLRELDLPMSQWTTDLRRQHAAEFQASVLSVLTENDFVLTYQFEISAALGGLITRSGLEKLAVHPDVVAIGMVGLGTFH